MIIARKIRAKKYAQAYLNLYFDALTEDTIANLAKLHDFLVLHRGVLCYLNLPTLTEVVWQNFLNEIRTCFGVPDSFISLVQSLQQRRKISDLPVAIVAIMEEFFARRHIIDFVVTSSHELDSGAQKNVIDFLRERLGGVTVRAKFEVDRELICGIKMRSNQYVFEHSVAKDLKKFKELLLEQAAL